MHISRVTETTIRVEISATVDEWTSLFDALHYAALSLTAGREDGEGTLASRVESFRSQLLPNVFPERVSIRKGDSR